MTVIEVGMHVTVLNPAHIELYIKCIRTNSNPNSSSSGRVLVLCTCVNLRLTSACGETIIPGDPRVVEEIMGKVRPRVSS